jgi:hypothetical protein
LLVKAQKQVSQQVTKSKNIVQREVQQQRQHQTKQQKTTTTTTTQQQRTTNQNKRVKSYQGQNISGMAMVLCTSIILLPIDSQSIIMHTLFSASLSFKPIQSSLITLGPRYVISLTDSFFQADSIIIQIS